MMRLKYLSKIKKGQPCQNKSIKQTFDNKDSIKVPTTGEQEELVKTITHKSGVPSQMPKIKRKFFENEPCFVHTFKFIIILYYFLIFYSVYAV